MLQKYNILTLKSGTNDVKIILNQNNFVINEDFKLRNVPEFNSVGGRGNKNEYFLHPRAFKICLMRSLKTRKYANYYLLLEESIKYFNDYQIELKDTYNIILNNKILEKDSKINSLEEKLDNIISNNNLTLEELKKSNIKNEQLEKYMIKANHKLDNMKDELYTVKEDLVEIKDELNDTNIKLDISIEDRAPKTKSTTTRNMFVILKTDDISEKYKYYTVRGQKKYVKDKILNMSNFYIFKKIEYIPNAITLGI
jgi:hypothetical protein